MVSTIRHAECARTSVVTRPGVFTLLVLKSAAMGLLACQHPDDPCPGFNTSGFVLEIDGQRTTVECVGANDFGGSDGFQQGAELGIHPGRNWLELTVRDLSPATDSSDFPITLQVPNGAYPWWFRLAQYGDSGETASCEEEAVGSTFRIDAISIDPERGNDNYKVIDAFDGEFDVTLENCTFPPLNINARDVRVVGRWYWYEE